MTRNTSDALPFVRERLGAGQRLTAPDKLGWNQKIRRNPKPTELQPWTYPIVLRLATEC